MTTNGDLENLGPEKIGGGLPWRLMSLALILLGVLVASYLGLRFGYGTVLNSKINTQNAEIDNLAQSVPDSEQQQLLRFYTQLGNLRSALGRHVLTSKVWALIERVTNRNVYYTGADLDIAQRRLSLDGVARSYDFLAQQLAAYKTAPEIEEFILNQTDTRGTTVSFRVVLVLTENTFK